jgi:hypothetical protein
MGYILFEELIKINRRWEIDVRTAKRVTTPNFRGFSKLPLAI